MGIRAAVAHYWDKVEDIQVTNGPPFVCLERAGEGAGVDVYSVRHRSRVFELFPSIPTDGGQARFVVGRLRGLLTLRAAYDGAVPMAERRVMQAEDAVSLMELFANPNNYLSGTTDTINPLTTRPEPEAVVGEGDAVLSEVVTYEFEHIYREA